MSCILHYFTWWAGWWTKNGVQSQYSAMLMKSDDIGTVEGWRTYAHRQASIQDRLKMHCANAWKELDSQLKIGAGAAKNIGGLV
jgi:hypothetical protein